MHEEAAQRYGAAAKPSYRVVLYSLLGLAAVDGVVASHSRAWRAYDPNPYRECLEGCRQQAWDLVVIGGSPAESGIDPAVLAGLPWQGRSLDRVYNLSLPLATIAEVYHAVEHGLPVPPRLLVYGITATDLNEDRVEPSGPRQLMDVADVLRWSWGRPEAAAWCLRHFLQERLAQRWQLFYYRNGIRLWAADRAERLCPGLCSDAAAEARAGLQTSAALRAGHGFMRPPPDTVARYDRLKAQGAFGPTFPFLERYQLSGYLRYLNRLLDWAEQQGVPIVLVDLPVPADLDERYYPQAFARYRAALAEVQRARGLAVLHATRDATGLTDADFGDQIHLNAAGCARLSAWLRSQLAELSRQQERATADVAGAQP